MQIPRILGSALFLNFLGRILPVLKTRPRKALDLLAWVHSHLETLEAKYIAHHQELVKIWFLLLITVTLRPTWNLFCRLHSPVKLSTQRALKKLRIGGIS